MAFDDVEEIGAVDERIEYLRRKIYERAEYGSDGVTASAQHDSRIELAAYRRELAQLLYLRQLWERHRERERRSTPGALVVLVVLLSIVAIGFGIANTVALWMR